MRMAGEIEHVLTPPPEGLKLLGPAEAPVPRLKNEFRYQLLLKAASRRTLSFNRPRTARSRPRAPLARQLRS